MRTLEPVSILHNCRIFMMKIRSSSITHIFVQGVAIKGEVMKQDSTTLRCVSFLGIMNEEVLKQNAALESGVMFIGIVNSKSERFSIITRSLDLGNSIGERFALDDKPSSCCRIGVEGRGT